MKVLVVNFNTEHRRIIQNTLESRGHEVFAFGDAKEALSEFKNKSFSLVILDGGGSGSDGLQFSRQIRSSYPENDTFILMCMEENRAEGAVAALEAGANDFLLKPIDRIILNKI